MKKQSYEYFWERYDETPPVWDQIFEVVTIDGAYSKFSSAIGLGKLLEKPEGEDLKPDAPIESYTIVCRNRSFGRIVRFSYETVQDSQQIDNILADTVGTWGRQVPITREEFFAQVFNYGAYSAGHDVFNNTITGVVTDSSGDYIYDSKAFFATDHADKVGNTYVNFSASNSLTAANLKTVHNTYTTTNNRDERGNVVNITPDTLLIPPALKFTAEEILNSTLIPSSADNTVNVLRGIVSPISWSYLTDADGWFLGKRQNGLVGSISDVDLDFWSDEISKDYFASIFTRMATAVVNWRYWYSNSISTS